MFIANKFNIRLLYIIAFFSQNHSVASLSLFLYLSEAQRKLLCWRWKAYSRVITACYWAPVWRRWEGSGEVWLGPHTPHPDTDTRHWSETRGTILRVRAGGAPSTIMIRQWPRVMEHRILNTAQTHCIIHSLAYWKIYFLHGYLNSFIYYIHHTSYIHNRSSLDIKIWLRLNAFRLHNQSKAKLTINSLLFILACVSKYLCDSSRHWLKITLIGLLWWMSQDWYVPCICRVSALACLYWLCGLCLEGDWWLIQWLLPPSHPSSAHIQTSQNHRNNNKYACVSSNMELGKSFT